MSSEESPKFVRCNPFKDLRIQSNSFLNEVAERSPCKKCNKSRKLFCYTCLIPVDQIADRIPRVNLPVKIDIIKHRSEVNGKSSAMHAPILASDDVRVFTYPNIPDYDNEEGVYLIFPSATSLSVKQLFRKHVQFDIKENYGLPKGEEMGTLLRFKLDEITLGSQTESAIKYTLENLPVKRAVFIDSTWNQSRSIYKDSKINKMKTVVVQSRLSQFWRHQKESPRWYLSTIEAIHQFLLEVHVNAWGLDHDYKGLHRLGLCDTFLATLPRLKSSAEEMETCRPYCGQYDNILFFFTYMYDLIHTHYDHDELKSYKRPIE